MTLVGKNIALISGIAGQDGSYLAELLLKMGYEVHGLLRRNSTPEHQESRLAAFNHLLHLHYADILDSSSINRIISELQPTEFYNLAAQSHVRISFEIPYFTAQVNGLGPLLILEGLRQFSPATRFYQASSSEMFGDSVDADGFQRESTSMRPVSPYGCSKLFAYSITRNYRKAYGLFASNGILFNHESPRRASNFVTGKIIKTAVQIKLGQASELRLGNLDSKRDWGHSKDYVRAMQLILSHKTADDFVVATGYTHSVRDFLIKVFEKLNLDYEKYVKIDKKFMRPEELPYLKGDSTKARDELGWKPEVSFDEMIEEMITFWETKLAIN